MKCCEVLGLGVSALTVNCFPVSHLTAEPSVHSDLQPHHHLEDHNNHILLPQVAPEVGLRGPEPEQSEVVFLNVTSVKSLKPAEAVLPPLIPPPVSSLLPDGLYQPGPLGPLDYDDYDNAIDDGNSNSFPSLIITFFFPLSFCFCFVLI